MFGFKKTSESDRLRAVYADQSDGELLRLYDERDGLTDAAQEALAEVMQQRKLESPAATPPYQSDASTEITNRGNATSVELAPEEVWLYTFRDTYEVSQAVRLLEEAAIRLRLADRSEFHGQGLKSRNEVGIVLIVERSHEDQARALLQKHLQLFPSSEVEGAPDIALDPPSEMTLLLMCDRAHALSLVEALSAAGLSFFWRDGREERELPNEDTVALEVHAAQHARADEVLQAWTSEMMTRENTGEDEGP